MHDNNKLTIGFWLWVLYAMVILSPLMALGGGIIRLSLLLANERKTQVHLVNDEGSTHMF
jgi:hypothetical protein